MLKKKVAENDEYKRRLGEYEYEFKKVETYKRENEDLRSKFSDSIRKNSEYENKIALFSQEIERLNLILKRKVSEIDGLEESVRNYKREMEESSRKFQHQEMEYRSKLQASGANSSQNDQLLREKEGLRLNIQNLENELQFFKRSTQEENDKLRKAIE